MTSSASALAFLLLKATLLFPSPLAAANDNGEVSSQIMAVVGDEAITLEDVKIRVKFATLISKKSVTDDEAFEQLVKEGVKVGTALQLKVKPELEEVKIIRGKVFEMLGIKTKEDYSKFLEQHGITQDSVERYIYANAVWSKMVYGVHGSNIAPTKLEMQGELEQYVKKVQKSDEWEIGIIALGEDNPKFESLSTQISSQINPQNFESLARRFSDDQSRIQGGYLGWRVPENVKLTIAIESTEVGDVSRPVETQSGVVFVKVYNKRKALPPVSLEWGEIMLPRGGENETVAWLRREVRNCYQLEGLDVTFRSGKLTEIGNEQAAALANVRENQFSRTRILPGGGVVIYMVCEKRLPEDIERQMEVELANKKERLYSKLLYKTLQGRVKVVLPTREDGGIQ